MKVNFNTISYVNKSYGAKNQTNPGFGLRANGVGTVKDVFQKNIVSDVSFTGIYTKGLTKAERALFSKLELERLDYIPKLPPIFKNGIKNLNISEGGKTEAIADKEVIRELFPNTYGQPILKFNKGVPKASAAHKVGVILSGGQASGGHNVITGLYDALKKANPKSEVYGFLGGPKGLIEGKYTKLNDDMVNKYRNQGGFDMIGSGRDKIEKEEHFEGVLATCKKLGIKAVTIIGGDDSNTNAALLSEWFAKKGEKISVIGCPKTIDGDLKNAHIETPFGFDTATKTFSETVGNIQRDAKSAKKYWHFVKVMGRSASHVALEVAHQTHPNITLISEEVAKKGMKLDDVVTSMAKTIAKRAETGKNYGVAVIPEGVIEFIPDFNKMIATLDKVLPKMELEDGYKALTPEAKAVKVIEALDDENAKLFGLLPVNIKKQLITEKRDAHGNFPVSQLETDKLLIDMVKSKLGKMAEAGEFKGKFSAVSQFSGYDGRSGLPSNFDADYCYSLGHSAAALINNGKTGYMATVKNLSKPVKDWEAGGSPITMMLNMEERNGKMKPVIQKALVELEGPVFKDFEKNRKLWAIEDKYINPGPIQYKGSTSNLKTNTLLFEQAVKK